MIYIFLCYSFRLRFWEIWIPRILKLRRPNLSIVVFFSYSEFFLCVKIKALDSKAIYIKLWHMLESCNSFISKAFDKSCYNPCYLSEMFFYSKSNRLFWRKKNVNVKALKNVWSARLEHSFVPVAFFTPRWTLFLEFTDKADLEIILNPLDIVVYFCVNTLPFNSFTLNATVIKTSWYSVQFDLATILIFFFVEEELIIV